MINFKNTYTRLPERFYSKTEPKVFTNPSLLIFNNELAQEKLNIDLTPLSNQEKANYFSGAQRFKSSCMISTAYSGHQFGHFNPTLGDGRAILLGEVINKTGERFDLQLKGAGPTAYSRQGDGLSSLGPVLREYLVSEAMYHLGIPTTRALCAVSTGDQVHRESSLPGGVLTRVASSHIRIGTFEYFASRADFEGLKLLADYAIERHYPQFKHHPDKYLELIGAAAKNWSSLIAKWMSVGFIHGVMNTDNMSICGETIDFGPCAFMDTYKANQVYSYIDRNGRYAYSNQINIGKWNLARFASALLSLIDSDESLAVQKTNQKLESLYHLYDQEYVKVFSAKLGIIGSNKENIEHVNSWLEFFERNKLDFTLSFYRLTYEPEFFMKFSSFNEINKKRLVLIENSDLAIEVMKKMNPFLIPRNHQIEKIIQQGLSGDFRLFYELNEALRKPWQPNQEFGLPPSAEEEIENTFCGT